MINKKTIDYLALVFVMLWGIVVLEPPKRNLEMPEEVRKQFYELNIETEHLNLVILETKEKVWVKLGEMRLEPEDIEKNEGE
jgi:hypothetical protein